MTLVIDGQPQRRRQMALEPTFDRPEPSTLEKLAGGALVGARRDPIMRLAIDRISEELGVPTEQLQELERRLEGSTLADVAELVGEFGPSLALGMGAFGLGRAAGLRGLEALAVNSRLAGMSQIAARAAGQEVAFGKAAQVLSRGAQAIGGAAGFAGLGGAQSLAGGSSRQEALKAALASGGFALGVEAGFAGLGLLPGKTGLLRRSRDVPLDKLEAKFAKEGRPVLQARQRKLQGQVGKLNREIREIQRSGQQEIEFIGSRSLRENLEAQARAGLSEEALAKIKPMQQALRQKRAELGALRPFLRGEADKGITYTRAEPWQPEGIKRVLAQLNQKIARTPESYQGELGKSYAMLHAGARDAEARVTIASNLNEAVLTDMRKRLAKAMGLRVGQRSQNQRYAQIFQEWERNAENGVIRYMQRAGRSADDTRDALRVFAEYDAGMAKVFDQLTAIGAQSRLTAQELSALRVQKYVPHILTDMSEQDLLTIPTEELGAARALRIMRAGRRAGPARFASIDFQRNLPGTLEELAQRMTRKGKTAFDRDVWSASLRYLNAAHRRLEYGKRFGLNNELAEVLAEAAIREGASAPLVTSLKDVMLGNQYYDAAMRQLANTVLGTQVGFKLALAVIPNMSQSTNTVLFNGLRNTTKGLQRSITDRDFRDVITSVAWGDSIVRGVGLNFRREQLARTESGIRLLDLMGRASDRFAWSVLNFSGFNTVERWNRIIAGAAAQETYRHNVTKAMAGKLRGASLERARRQMRSMGIELDDAVRALRTNNKAVLRQLEERATFQGAQLTQFTPSRLRRPEFWSHPAGRVMFQFKNFALGQYRFLRDQVVAEAARGNMAPLAYFVSMYPVAGEFVKGGRALATLQERDEKDFAERFVHDLLAVGGFGLATDLMVQARFGRTLGFVAGPTATDIADVVSELAQADGAGLFDQVRRQPVYKWARAISVPPLLTLELAEDAMQLLEEPTTDAGWLRLEQAQEKQR